MKCKLDKVEASWETLIISIIAMLYGCFIFPNGVAKGDIGYIIMFFLVAFNALFVNLFIDFKNMEKIRKISWMMFIISIATLSTTYSWRLLSYALFCADAPYAWCGLGGGILFAANEVIALLLIITASIVNIISFKKQKPKNLYYYLILLS